jgi:hypothetical protein
LFPQRETIKDRHEIVVQGKQRNTKIRRICCTRKEKEYKIEEANDLVAAAFCSNTYLHTEKCYDLRLQAAWLLCWWDDENESEESKTKEIDEQNKSKRVIRSSGSAKL